MAERDEVLIAGGGVIGLACAWRAAQRGLSVRVLERSDALAAGATGVAAGMLAPVGEASWGEESLLELGLHSMRLWDGFAAELNDQSGEPAGYGRIGALHVALDRDEAAELRRRHDLHRQPRARFAVAAPERVSRARARYRDQGRRRACTHPTREPPTRSLSHQRSPRRSRGSAARSSSAPR